MEVVVRAGRLVEASRAAAVGAEVQSGEGGLQPSGNVTAGLEVEVGRAPMVEITLHDD